MKRIPIFILFLLTAALSMQAGTDNIAPLAATQSSGDNAETSKSANVNDGIIGIRNKGVWVSNSHRMSWGEISYPSISLKWDEPHWIDRIVIYDLPELSRHTAAGELLFSDGSTVSVTCIPNDGRGKEIRFEERKVSWVKFTVSDGDGDRLGLSEIEVYPSLSEPNLAYTEICNPYIETTRGRYFFFVTGSQPFGMISSAPLTRNKNQGGGGYNYNSLEILGFPQVHGWMLSGLNFMPVMGNVDCFKGENEWKSPFSHDSEIVQPGYHRVFLEKYGIWVEQTASDRVGMYRMTFTREGDANLLVSLGGYLATTTMNDCKVTKIDGNTIEGSFNTTGRLWGGPENVRIFFVMKTDAIFAHMDAWNDKEMLTDVATHQGTNEKHKQYNEYFSYYDAPQSGVSLNYPGVKPGDEIMVKFAISYTSVENARNNLENDAMAQGWDFDDIKHKSLSNWNEWFGRIDVQGGTAEQRMKFYTDLWHVLLGRHKIDDINGDYPDYTQGGTREGNHVKNAKLIKRTLPKKKDGSAKYHMYNSDSFWLSQWNLNVLWGLAWPEVLDDFAASLVQYDTNGGLLPRGPNAGGYSFIMDGCPATNLLVSAYQKGMMTKVSPDKAFKAMVRNHRPGGMLGDKEGIEHYIKHGYYPGNAGTTVEIAFQDWSLGQMALRMGKKKEHAYYDRRSHGWTALFNSKHNLIMPKTAEGKWLHDDPMSGWGWMEANAWQATWSLSHDLPRLSQLMGGYDKMCDMLDFAFKQSEKDKFVFGYGAGYISYANQPGLSNAHVFNLLGKPWLSQYWVRKVNALAYGSTSPLEGYGGHDEDQGQMGATSALMSLGLFSLDGTNSVTPTYELTSPVFDSIEIKLNPDYYKSDKFIIRCNNNSAENCYIQSLALNGKTLTAPRITHDEISKGAVLEITLGDTPVKTITIPTK